MIKNILYTIVSIIIFSSFSACSSEKDSEPIASTILGAWEIYEPMTIKVTGTGSETIEKQMNRSLREMNENYATWTFAFGDQLSKTAFEEDQTPKVASTNTPRRTFTGNFYVDESIRKMKIERSNVGWISNNIVVTEVTHEFLYMHEELDNKTLNLLRLYYFGLSDVKADVTAVLTTKARKIK